MPPAVSVIVPTYDRPRLLREAVASVQDQTFRDWECLVSDDGSPTPAESALGDLPGPDVRIRVLRGEHTGLLGRVRNRALEEARGRYVAFLDDDDLWAKDKLELQVKRMEEEPEVSLLFGRAERFGGGRGLLPHRRPARWPVFGSLWRRNFIPCSTVLLRREILEISGVFDEQLRVAQDYDLWLRISRLAPIAFEDRVVCRYRVHPRAMTLLREEEANALETIRERLAARWRLSPRFRPSARRGVTRLRPCALVVTLGRRDPGGAQALVRGLAEPSRRTSGWRSRATGRTPVGAAPSCGRAARRACGSPLPLCSSPAIPGPRNPAS